MKLNDIIVLLSASSENAAKASVNARLTSNDITKTKAYQLYGRTNVDRWILEGLIKFSNKKLDRAKLETIAGSSNRSTYLPVADR